MKDVKLNSVLDLDVAAGDLVVDESTQQHQQLLLTTVKGDWKENPTIGVGVFGFLKGDNTDGLLGEIKQELERDGMTVGSLGIEDDKILIDASYT